MTRQNSLVAHHLLWHHHDDVCGGLRPGEAPVNLLGQSPGIVVTALDHQQVDIAVRAHLTTGGGTEQNDLLRLCHPHHPMDDVVQHCLGDRAGPTAHRTTPHGRRSVGAPCEGCLAPTSAPHRSLVPRLRSPEAFWSLVMALATLFSRVRSRASRWRSIWVRAVLRRSASDAPAYWWCSWYRASR